MELGIGTHLCAETFEEVLHHAFAKGCRFIDTAPNYGAGLAQALVGSSLRSCVRLPSSLRVTTKVGFLSRLDRRAMGEREPLSYRHSLEAAYIRFRSKQNSESLRPIRPACLFLHNPEEQMRGVSRKTARERLAGWFEICEEVCGAGYADSYGVATWSGLLNQLSLREQVQVAKDVAGEANRFRYFQHPLSLVRPEMLRASLAGGGPLVEGVDLGISIIASSPLHTGELPTMLDRSFVASFEPSLSPAQLALQLVRSAPGLEVVLASCTTVSQFDELCQVMALEPWSTAETKKMLDLIC